MGIIAQDPVLLSGSLRINLDIEGTYDDQALMQALQQVQLINARELSSAAGSETSSLTVVGDTDAQAGKINSTGNVNIFTNLDHEIESGGQK
jgi:ABC-type multidrug transport system fused ATPase/permease subunit